MRELASELLTRAEDDPTQPIPVNVNLSSWALKKPPLTAWMMDRLWETYNIRPHLSQGWIEQNQLLFLLDGLDEVELSARTECIEAINAYLAGQEHIIPIVVCSRSHEYLEQEKQLNLSVAVEVRPLTSEQVDSYLKGTGRSLAAVRATLRSNAVLRELVTTPLMLSVVMLAYRGKMVKDLPQLGSAEDQQHQVFGYYVTRMLEQRARKWHYSFQQLRRGLIWLAQQMQQRQLTEFYLEQLQRSWLPTERAQGLYPWLLGLVIELLVGLVGGLVGGLVLGLVGGLVGGLVLGLVGGLAGGLVAGLLIGLVGGLLIGLSGGLSGEQLDEEMRIKPNQGIHDSGWNALRVVLVSALAFGVVFGLVGGLVLGLVGGLSSGLVNGLIGLVIGAAAGLVFGLVLAIYFGGAALLSHYLIRLFFWQKGVMPWYYVRFLEEATERVLLEHVGGGYRFIHPLFRDYFASLATSAPSTSS